MRIILKILNYFFVTLGVLFFFIILIGIYLFVADPFGLKPLLSSFTATPSSTADTATPTNKNTDKNPLLTPAQEKTLEAVGIDPAKLPTNITPDMEKCLVEKVGAQRALEIVKGASPTPAEVLKASVCLK